MMISSVDMLTFSFSLVIVLISMWFPSTLVYSVCLVFYVCITLGYLVGLNLLAGLMGLLVMLVYVGAMMIMISYICAVSPNIKYFNSILTMGISFFCVLSMVVLMLISPSLKFSLFNSYTLTPAFLFTDVGLWLMLVLSLLMVIILMLSTYISPSSSSLRSTNSSI